MAHPNAEWVRFGAESCFRFERRAAERNALAAEVQGVGNDRVQQAEVDWRLVLSDCANPKPVGR